VGGRVRGSRGAAFASRPGSESHRVIVTDIVATEVDAGVGDVYGATARAVWQALSIDPPLSCPTWLTISDCNGLIVLPCGSRLAADESAH
jgi:hypothetical protein